MFIYCKYQPIAWKLPSLQILHWALSKIILPYTSLHTFITSKNISDEVTHNVRISRYGETWKSLGLKSYGMRCYLDVSVLPDILKTLQSLQTLQIAYAVMMHMQWHCITTQKAWNFNNTAVRNSNLKQIKLNYVSKLKHYRWCMWASIKLKHYRWCMWASIKLKHYRWCMWASIN
jgi:hypothetical protein